MLGSIYKGMVGMQYYSKGLDNISGNVANLNTTGFKRTDMHFRDMLQPESGFEYLGSQYTSYAGVGTTFTSVNFSQGEISATGNNTDIAIEGNGFFILRNGNETYYSRVGEFQFDEDGYLVAKGNGYKVAALDKDGQLSNINIKDFRSSDPLPTTEVLLVGNLSTGSTTHTVTEVAVYDNSGKKHVLDLQFTNNSADTENSWTVEVTNEDDEVLATGLEIRFNANGSPAEGYNNIEFTVETDDGDSSNISINVGNPGSFNQVTNFSGGASSTVETDKIDGAGPGIMIGFDITEEGEISANYSNGESKGVATLALARVESPDSLTVRDGGLFQHHAGQRVTINTAGKSGLGSIQGQSLELSNVDLTEQFGNMIVLQRGYQASSQVLTTANEMLQQLMDSTKGR